MLKRRSFGLFSLSEICYNSFTMGKDQGLQSIKNIIENKKTTKPPPAHPWQDFALQIIDELKIPGFKRSAVFKICKQHPKAIVEKAFNDTKELCKTGDQWKYFFKLMAQ